MPLQESAQGKWLELKGTIKQQWGKLTDNDLTEINGNRERLVGKIVSMYSKSEDEAKKEVDRFWKEDK